MQFDRAIPELFGSFVVDLGFLNRCSILISLIVESLWLIDLHATVVALG